MIGSKTCKMCGSILTGKYQKEFCSHKCAASFNNRSRTSTTKNKLKSHICIKCGEEFKGSIHLTKNNIICPSCRDNNAQTNLPAKSFCAKWGIKFTKSAQIFAEHFEDVHKMMENKKPFIYIASKLGLNTQTVTRYIKKIDINYRGVPNKDRVKPIIEIINNNNIPNSRKRKTLISSGYKEEKCEYCGLSSWNGNKIPLELHHKDFNHWNNSLDNLMIVCRNCHAVLHNYKFCKHNKQIDNE